MLNAISNIPNSLINIIVNKIYINKKFIYFLELYFEN